MKGNGTTVRQRRFRIVNALAAVAVVCAASLVAAPTSALAEPSVAWEASLDNGVTPARMFGHADGKVTVAACGAPSGDAAQARTYASGNPAGSTIDLPNNTGPRLYACTGQSTLGKDGTLYASGVTGNQSRLLLALKDGQLKWSKAFPTGCDDAYSLVMGVNGNVYGVVGCNGSYRLIGYTPEVAPGSTEPSVPLDVAITGQFPGYANDSLAAYDDGLVVQLNNGLQYFSYNGSTNGPVVIPDFRETYERTIAADTNGLTFYPVAATQNDCGSGSWGAMAQIQARTSTQVAWSHPLPLCTHVVSIRPSFNGGAVADLYKTDGHSGIRRLIGLDAQGNESWEAGFNPTTNPELLLNHTTSITIRGDVLLQESYQHHGDTSINARRARISLISGVTGQTIDSKEFVGETSGYTVNGNVTAATNTGRVYVVLSQCSWDYCGSSRKLYALNLTGADLDFPRGAVLKHDEPWLTYVGFGDSYSSGVGVKPYGPPSDTNGCHRSEAAYAKLLDGAPAPRLKLAAFVACSGATSANIRFGKNGEPPQIDVLNTVDADLITVSVGGNDMGFVEFATVCVTGDCSGSAKTDALWKIEHELPGSLGALFSDIKVRAPQARVLVVGYPILVPYVVNESLPNCVYLLNDKDAARTVLTELNKAIKEAVRVAGPQFEFVDAAAHDSPFNGHELCKDSNSYFHGLVIPVPPADKEFMFHPNAAGHEAYRRLIATHLSRPRQ